MKHWFERLSIKTKAVLIMLLFAGGLLANIVFSSLQNEQQIRTSYEQKAIHLVESASNILQSHHSKQLSGALSLSEAQNRALDSISAMRFDGGNYIFVADEHGISISNPIRKMIGKNILGLKDPNGKHFVQALYNEAKRGGGFVDYRWPESPGSKILITKTSYAVLFSPWGWTLGTGLNMEALNGDIAHARYLALSYALPVLLVCVICLWILVQSILRPLAKTTEAMKQLSRGDGDLGQPLAESGSQEIRELIRYFNQFVESIRHIVIQVNESAVHVSATAEQLNRNTQQVYHNLTEQHQQNEHLANAMLQIRDQVDTVNQRTDGALSSASNAAQATGTGMKVIHANIESANSMAQDITRAGQVISQLAEDSANVDRVLDVIRTIAEQTNLLALNAAIEAARAGSAGRGFAVVADEVRSLSKRTQDSTAEIQQIIEKLQQGAQQAALVMSQGIDQANNSTANADTATGALSQINQEVEDIEAMNRAIVSACDLQNQSVVDVSEKVIQQQSHSASILHNAGQMEQACEELTRVASDLVSLIGRFRT